jgi:hypothetical protein
VDVPATVAVSGAGPPPTGTVVFTAYGPSDATCAGPAAFTSSPRPITGTDASSGPFTPVEPGTYLFRAAYSGDSNYNGVTTPCNDANESTTVTSYTPAITTKASAPVLVGGAVSDSATLSMASPAASGTLTFDLYGPDNATCTGPPVDTSSRAVAGNGDYTSVPFTPTAPGTYRFVVTYTGDVKNTSAVSPCNAANESTTVSAPLPPGGGGGATPSASPSVSPSASPSASPTPSAPASPAPSVSPSGDPCPAPAGALPIRADTRTINATGLGSVTVSGARPGRTVLLQGYSQNHYGTASFDNDQTPVDRRGVANSSGTVTFDDLRPASNTRLRAREEGCAQEPNPQTAVIEVRAQETLVVTRVGPRSYVFSGKSIPARPGGLIISLYRIVGTPCVAGVEPRDCPGEVFIGQARASAITGNYRIPIRFPLVDQDVRDEFVVKTGRDAQNAPGRSNVRSLLIF